MANLNGLSTATLFVGIIELVLSVLLFTQVAIDLLAPGPKEATRRHFSVLGLHLANLEEWAAEQHSASWLGVEVSLVVFSTMYAVVSGLLVLGSMWRNWRFTVPWLVMSAVSIVCQVISLALRQNTRPYSLNDWEMMIAIWNIIVCLGIWTLVYKTQKRWARNRRNPAASTVAYSFEDESSSVNTPLLCDSDASVVGNHQALGEQDAPLDNVQAKTLLDDPAVPKDAPAQSTQAKTLSDDPVVPQAAPAQFTQAKTLSDDPVVPQAAPAQSTQAKTLSDDPAVPQATPASPVQRTSVITE